MSQVLKNRIVGFIKHGACILLFLTMDVAATAQDTLILKEGDTLHVSLIEIRTDSIHFKKGGELNVAVYSIAVSRIKKIIFRDGIEEELTEIPVQVSAGEQRQYMQIPISELKPVEFRGNSAYTVTGVKLSDHHLKAMFNSANSAEAIRYFKNYQISKSLSLSARFMAIPVSIVCIPACLNLINRQKPAELGYALFSVVSYAVLETGFVYFFKQSNRHLKSSVNSYNRIFTGIN